VSVTAGLKLGIKTADFGSTPVSSRTGESAWDKLLIYEPGDGNGGTSDGLWHTESTSFTSGNWWLVDSTVGANTIASPIPLSAMVGNPLVVSGAKTLGQEYALITAAGARITSVEFGIGSGNPGGSVYVNQLKCSAYQGNALIEFGSIPLACDQNATPDVLVG